MKKLLSVILALLMLFSLAALIGCEKKDAAADPSAPAAPAADPAAPAAPAADPAAPAAEGDAPVDLAATKPCEYVREKLDAGMEVNVAFSGGFCILKRFSSAVAAGKAAGNICLHVFINCYKTVAARKTGHQNLQVYVLAQNKNAVNFKCRTGADHFLRFQRTFYFFNFFFY